MRLLVPILDFGASGGYRVLAELANSWQADDDVDCSFVVPWFAGSARYPVTAEVIHVDALGRQRPRHTQDLTGIPRVALAQQALTLGLRRLVQAGDVILSNHFLTTNAALGLERRGAIHVRLMQAEEAEYYPGNSPRARLFRHLVHRADRLAPWVIVNSPEFLIGDPRRLGVLPPGIDLSNFAPGTPTPRPLTIGTVGRAEPWKGTQRVLEAVRLADIADEYVVSIADFGADLAEFSELPIRTTTPSTDAQLAEWYRSVDYVMVGASGQPGAYHYPCIEALASGATLITPWYRPADPNNAWLVERPEPVELAATLRGAMADPERRANRRANGLETVRTLDWNELAPSAIDLIRRAAKS